MFVGEMSLKHWMNKSLPCAIFEVIYANILKRDDEHFSLQEHCVKSIMELAISCCAYLPEERVNMMDVVAMFKINFKFLISVRGAR